MSVTQTFITKQKDRNKSTSLSLIILIHVW